MLAGSPNSIPDTSVGQEFLRCFRQQKPLLTIGGCLFIFDAAPFNDLYERLFGPGKAVVNSVTTLKSSPKAQIVPPPVEARRRMEGSPGIDLNCASRSSSLEGMRPPQQGARLL